jgi:curved DNA-binding protein CbpA
MYRDKARKAHPDNGGSHELMARLNQAISEARRELHP